MGKTKLLVAGLALAGLTLAGCGGETTPGVAGTPGANAPTTSAAGDAGTAAFDSIKALSDAVSAKSSDAQSAKMKMVTSAAGQQINAEGEFRFAGADTAMAMTMEVPGFGSMEMRLVEGIMYIKMPAQAGVDPAKPWLKLDPSDPNNPMAAQLGSLLQTAERSDPRTMLSEFAKVGEIKDVQSDTIDGQDTQKYTIEVELAKLSEDNNLGIDPDSAAELEKAGLKTVTYDVWVNDDQLPVRMVSEMTIQGQKVKVQVDYTDWGSPVEVEAPAASEVGEFPGGN
ncbi:hypothetical protein [Actinokineospora sp. NPDC004072]